MGASIEDIEREMRARDIEPKLIHFGFKRVDFQLPPCVDGVFALRIAACGKNHLNIVVVSKEKCIRLEPQKFSKMMYCSKRLDRNLKHWCNHRMYRVHIGNDKTGTMCVKTCFEMLDNLFKTQIKNGCRVGSDSNLDVLNHVVH
jgi:hypothetical protein